MHKSVLCNEILSVILPKDNGKYLDLTFGAGGHSRLLLESCECSVYSVDLDTRVSSIAHTLEEEFAGRFFFTNNNFSNIAHIYPDITFDGIIADLGVSNMQIFDYASGFSFNEEDSTLDMRFDGCTSSSDGLLCAHDIINNYSHGELVSMFMKYGDDYRYSKRLAREICIYRKKGYINKTKDFINIIKRINDNPGYLSKIFQSLRVVVNNEVENLQSMLIHSLTRLAKNGCLAVITFNPMEDSIVKRFIFDNSADLYNRYQQEDTFHTPLVSIKKPQYYAASEEELGNNNMARSAKLRYCYKI